MSTVEQSLKRASLVFAAVPLFVSILVCIGWQYRIPTLRGEMSGSFVAPNTALCFILCGFSIILQFRIQRWRLIAGQAAALFVALFALAVLAEYAFRADFGIDRIFFAHRLSDWHLSMPGRFALNSAFAFACAGIGLFTLRSKHQWPIAETTGIAIVVVSYLSLIGYLYGVPALYASGSIMSVITATMFLFLGLSLMSGATHHPLTEIVISPHVGGIVCRRIVTAILVILPTLGWLEVKARTHEYVSREFGIALFVLLAVVIFTSLTLQTASLLNQTDLKRRNTEVALRESEHQQVEAFQQLKLNLTRLELIEGAVDAGTWEFDPATGISHWGAGISALWGLPRQEHQLTLEEFHSRIHPGDRERVMRTVQTVLTTQDTYEIEFRVVWPDQSVHWLGARGAVLRDDRRNPIKVIGIALEVTQRHQTEKALRDSEKLAATGRLAATIAHEINNPLEAVVNLVFLAKSNPALTPEGRTLLATADVELSRVSHMVRQTLGFYRESTNPMWVDLAEMAVQTLALYRNKMQRKSLKVDVQSKSAKVYGFEGELRQVVSNLISNAIDAVDANGRIRVRVRPCNGHVRVTVADNGHGIAAQDRVRLFQPFFTTKKDVGTGLGLWVSKGIIDKHNGRVRVRSTTRAGRSGTVFVIDLPQEAAKAAAQSATLAS